MHANKRSRTQFEEPASRDETNSAQDAKLRTNRACAECKRHKVKCEVRDGQVSCNKCLRSGIRCTPYNLTQKFFDEDAIWKSQTSDELVQLKAAVQALLQHNNLPELSTATSTAVPEVLSSIPQQQVNGVSPANYTSEGAQPVVEDDSDLIPLPMNNLYSLTEPRNSRLIRVNPADANGPDFISRGVVSFPEAELLFNHYRDHINPLLWDGILCPHVSLQDARKSSTLLVATVLTVAALQIPNREKSLTATYDAFVSLMRGSCLLRSQSLDDIRGLCIGAFYLTSLSWALCSRAVRVATEMNLHKSSLQFSRGSSKSHERVRLWYALYVCDHQFALAYGRPPMMHEDAAVRSVEKFLSSEMSTHDDIRLVAQVSLFRILADAYFMYACDPDLQLGEKDFQRLRSFNVSIDQWRLTYQGRATSEASSQAYIAKETVLYYHFARFQLNSLSLRGISARSTSRETSYADLSFDRREAANIAISAATSTLKLIVEEEDLCRALVGMPIFTHAMIAVCASFLLKMAVAFGISASGLQAQDQGIMVPRDLIKLGLTFYTEDALSLVQNLTQVLSSVCETASHRHVIRHVVTGLKELEQRFTCNNGGNYLYSRSTGSQLAVGLHLGNGSSRLASPNRDVASAVQPKPVDALTGSSESIGFDTGTDILFEKMNDDIEDPFDLLGDLDWRFNDGFLWRMDGDDPYY